MKKKTEESAVSKLETEQAAEMKKRREEEEKTRVVETQRDEEMKHRRRLYISGEKKLIEMN